MQKTFFDVTTSNSSFLRGSSTENGDVIFHSLFPFIAQAQQKTIWRPASSIHSNGNMAAINNMAPAQQNQYGVLQPVSIATAINNNMAPAQAETEEKDVVTSNCLRYEH